MLPLASTISFHIFTDAYSSFKGRKFARNLTFIYVTQIVTAVPIVLLRLIYVNNLIVLIFGTILYYDAIMVSWWLLVRYMSMDWRINFYWLPALQICYAVVFILPGISLLIPEHFLDHIIIYISLIFMAVEFVITKVLTLVFGEHRSNTKGITFAIAALMYPMETVRFVCFLLSYIKHRDEYPEYIVWSAIFSIIGELYTHTPLCKLLNNWIWDTIYGKRFNNFPEVYDIYSGLRSSMEYVAPAFIAINVLLANLCRHYIPVFDNCLSFIFVNAYGKLENNLWEVLAVYYLIELASEVACCALCKLLLYKRTSAVGDLKWGVLMIMIVYVGTAVDIPLMSSGFLRVLTA